MASLVQNESQYVYIVTNQRIDASRIRRRSLGGKKMAGIGLARAHFRILAHSRLERGACDLNQYAEGAIHLLRSAMRSARHPKEVGGPARGECV